MLPISDRREIREILSSDKKVIEKIKTLRKIPELRVMSSEEDKRLEEKYKNCTKVVTPLGRVNLSSEPLTSFEIAVRIGNILEVERRLAIGDIDVNNVSPDFTALQLAIVYGQIDIVKVLLANKRLKINHHPDDIKMACNSNLGEIVKLLLENDEIYESLEAGTYADLICDASINGRVGVLISLLAKKKDGVSYLKPLYCAIYNRHIAIVRILLQTIGSLAETDGTFTLELLRGAFCKLPEAIPLLLSQGANISKAISSKEISIKEKMVLCQFSLVSGKLTSNDAIEFMLAIREHGSLNDLDMNSIISNSFKFGLYSFIKFLVEENFINCNDVFNGKQTLLHYALALKSPDSIIEYLFSLPSLDYNIRNELKMKPLHVAMMQGHPQARVEFLIRKTSLKFVRAKDFDSMVGLACRTEQPNAVVRLLLESGADPNAHSTDFGSALVAVWGPINIELLSLLLDHGILLTKSGKTKDEIIAIATSQGVDKELISRIENKFDEEQKEVEVVVVKSPEAPVKVIERQVRSTPKTISVKKNDDRIENDWDRVSCWDAAGNPWNDDTFYHSIKNLLVAGRKEGKTREQIINENRHKIQEILPVKKKKVKPVKPPQVKPVEVVKVTTLPKKAPVRAISVGPSHANNNNEIDWTVPLKEPKRKPHDPNTGKYTNIKAATSEYLFLEGLFTWHRTLEKKQPIHDEIRSDNIWYSNLLCLNALSTCHELRTVEAETTTVEPIFCTDDTHTRILRNRVLHHFPSEEVLRHHTELLLKFLGPRIKHYSDNNTLDANPHLLVDLSKGELFNCAPADIDVDFEIRRQFEKIKTYHDYLNTKAGKQEEAFHKLGNQNTGASVFNGEMDYRHVDVFAARAIEACLVRLGKLYLMYKKQPIKTLSEDVVEFIQTLNTEVRKPAAHEIDIDNDEWHYSPLSSEKVKDKMTLAIRLLETGFKLRNRLNPGGKTFILN